MAFIDHAAKLNNWFFGKHLSEVAQLATAKHFKQGLGAAIIVTLIAGFAGIAGRELGLIFLYMFSLVYGWASYKWLNTPEGMVQIDSRMGTDRESEVAVAPHWSYFTYFITFGMIIIMLIPTAAINGPLGLVISYVLLMAAPSAIYWRNRKAI